MCDRALLLSILRTNLWKLTGKVLILLSFRILLVFTLTNIFGFFSWTEFGPSILGVQYTLIDFLSRENSSVNSCKNKSENINDGQQCQQELNKLSVQENSETKFYEHRIKPKKAKRRNGCLLQDLLTKNFPCLLYKLPTKLVIEQ